MTLRQLVVGAMLLGCPACLPALAAGPVAIPASNADPSGIVGEPPYEMTGREQPRPVVTDFEDLTGWEVVGLHGCRAEATRSREQYVFGQHAAKVTYRGQDPTSAFELRPSKPIPIRGSFTGVNLWVRGNCWGWENPPATTPTRIEVVFRDATGTEFAANLGTADFDYWFLMHATVVSPLGRLASVARPEGASEIRFPCEFVAIRVSNCGDPNPQKLFFDSLEFYTIDYPPLTFAAPPDDHLWSTAPDAIVPPIREQAGPQALVRDESSVSFRLAPGYRGVFTPKTGTLADFTFTVDGHTITPCAGAELSLDVDGQTYSIGPEGGIAAHLESFDLDGNWIAARWNAEAGGRKLRWAIRAQPVRKSIVVEVDLRGGLASALRLGWAEGVPNARAIEVPYLAYEWNQSPHVLYTTAAGGLYLAAWPDWHVSEGSALYAVPPGAVGETGHSYQGGILYNPKTDGKRNDLHERIVLCVSSRFDEVLPNIPHPKTDAGGVSTISLWRNIGFMFPEMLKQYKAYGIDHFIACHHEVIWRDAGESFTLRLDSAPKNVGDERLKEYSDLVRGLGYSFGLYTNYTDYAPVNRYWDENAVLLTAEGEWVRAWPRCYAPKGELAWEREAWFAPRINEKFHTTASYCDVATAVPPWDRVDYDARNPGAGRFRTVWESYARCLHNETIAHKGPAFSEGHFHWLYAGLVDGNYAQLTGPAPSKRAPLVDFDLLRLHPLETDFGMGDPGMFFKDSPDWNADHSRTSPWFDRFIASTIAFGHIGYLTCEWGLDGTLKSYFMVQPVQREYALVPVEAIRYRGDAGLVETSEALATGALERHRQVYVRYVSGLEVWANLSFDEDWDVITGSGPLRLPPSGWVAELPGKLRSYSAIVDAKRVDLLEAPDVVYADARGDYAKVGPVRTRGAVAIKREGDTSWVIPALEASPIELAPEAVGLRSGSWLSVVGVAENGSEVGRATVVRSPDGVVIEPVPNAIKYRVRAATADEPVSLRLVPDGGGRDLVRGDSRTVSVSVQNHTAGLRRGAVRFDVDGVVADSSVDIGPIPIGGSSEVRVPVALAADARSGALVRLTARADGAIPCVCIFRATEPVILRFEAPGAQPVGAGAAVPLNLVATNATPEPKGVDVSVTSDPAGARASARLTLRPAEMRSVPVPVTAPSEDAVTRLVAEARVGEVVVRTEAWARFLRSRDPLLSLTPLAPDETTMCQRGKDPVPLSSETGATFTPVSGQVGATTRKGFFAHPPYTGGVGWVEGTFRLTLPELPCALRIYVGFQNGSTTQDGCVFEVWAREGTGAPERAFSEQYADLGSWHKCEADLRKWAGKSVALSLRVDVGPRDNPVSDWALIGDPEVVPLEPAMRLDLSDRPLDLPYGPAPVRLDGLTAADLAGAAAAWLCLDSMGVDDGETYATGITVNGVACGPIPQGVGDTVWAEGVRIALPEAAVRALRAANEVIIENPHKDCFNVRNVYLRFRLADGREGASRVAKGPYAADPGWLYAQGTGNRLGSPLPTMLLEVPMG